MGVALERRLERREAAVAARPVADEFSMDEGLVTAAQSGDRAAFGQLYERYARAVHGVLLARVPYPEVDDLLHDVFLRALRKIRALREPAAFGGWLMQIARHRASDFHRRSRPAEELNENAGAREMEDSAAREALAAIQALPEAYRETLVLRLVEGLTGPEIAARTGLTHGSVRVNLHRGMKLLRETLQGEEGEALEHE
ncbi:MAG: RNA polymerase sigma factor [Candidatus Acidiferrales bacterium]